MGIIVSVSHDDDLVVTLLTERLYDPDLGRDHSKTRPMVFGAIHPEDDADVYLFLQFTGHSNPADNGWTAYRIRGDSEAEAIDEATKIYISIRDGFDYHRHLSLAPLRRTSSWSRACRSRSGKSCSAAATSLG